MTPLAVLHSAAEWNARFGADRRSTVLSVGNFDGIHLGHRKILRGAVERAKTDQAIPAAVTFDPHPLKILRPEEAPPLIATLEQRLAGLEEMGLEAALVLKFDLELSQLSPEEFVRRILVERLKMRAILVGDNFRFGHRQAGDVKLLQELRRRLGFEVEIVPPVVVRGEVVSSTAIRRAVSEGSVGDAARLLGRPFALTGEIRAGAGRGRTLLFPTLNLVAEQELQPKLGVYATETRVAGRPYRSATNVGVRPTFDGGSVTIESHLFDFSETLTSGRLEVRFCERLREEKRFSGPDELRAQIARDIQQAQEVFRQMDLAAAASRPA